MVVFGFFFGSALFFSTIWYLILRKITKKVVFYEYKHGEVRRWDE